MFDRLRNLRKQIAQAENVPGYIVFGDNSLKEMSVKYPRTFEQFLEISGVGEAKLKKYGMEFLSMINEYVIEKGIG